MTEKERPVTKVEVGENPPKESVTVPDGDLAASPEAFDMGLHLSDMGNTDRLFTQYSPVMMHSRERKLWLYWDGKVWEWDAGKYISFLAKETVKGIYREAADTIDDARRGDLVKWGLKSESERAISSMIELFKTEPGVAVELKELDTNQWLLNCQNGTLDLSTGELLKHDRKDRITRILAVDYDPDAPCPRWKEFLEQITGGDKALQGYLQRAVGYSLTGDTRTQVFFLLHGVGNNGKSTFLGTIRKLLGKYAMRASTDTFLQKDKNMTGPKEGIANLAGKRFVTASEIEDGRGFNTALIKDLTGGESISADRKYEHEFEFQPTCKIWVAGNHKPTVKDTTLSIWRRMKLIPFHQVISPENVDEGLMVFLEREYAGILAWAVQGCLAWQADGLQEPPIVLGATAIYRHDSDILAEFVEDCCILEERASMLKKPLREAYESWCEDNHYEKVTQRTFKARLEEKGLYEVRTGNKRNRAWSGIRLTTDADNADKS